MSFGKICLKVTNYKERNVFVLFTKITFFIFCVVMSSSIARQSKVSYPLARDIFDRRRILNLFSRTDRAPSGNSRSVKSRTYSSKDVVMCPTSCCRLTDKPEKVILKCFHTNVNQS